MAGPVVLLLCLKKTYEELRAGDLLQHERMARNVEDVLSAADGLATARLRHLSRGPRDFAALAHEVRKRIWRRLGGGHPFEALDGLKPLIDAHGSLRIATLNNDLILERWAKGGRIELCRGFDPEDRFQLRTLADSAAPIQMAKLHGSIDWVYETETGLRQVRGTFRTARGFTPVRSPVPDSAIVRWIVVESRGASVVELPSGRVLSSTRWNYLNLSDVAVASRDAVFLLEGGYEGEGRLLRWRPFADDDSSVSTVMEPLRSHGGIAVDPDAKVLRVALSEAGQVLESNLDDNDNLVSEPRVVVEGLRRPRWMTSCGNGEWWVSTSWGIVKMP